MTMPRSTAVFSYLARPRFAGALLVALASACAAPKANPDRAEEVARGKDAPEHYIPDDIDTRPDSAKLVLAGKFFDTDEEAQPDSLPTLAYGMTLETIRDGDRIFHGKGGGAWKDTHRGPGVRAGGRVERAGLADQRRHAGRADAVADRDAAARAGREPERGRDPLGRRLRVGHQPDPRRTLARWACGARPP
jgi:hypothetical protein